MNHRRDAWHAANGGLAVDVEGSGDDQSHREGHDQRLHPEHRDTDAVDEADDHPDQQPGNDAPRHSERCLARHDVGGGGGHVRDGQVDPACDDDECLAGGQDSERGGELQDVRHPVCVDRAGANHLDQPCERDEQRDQDNDGILLHDTSGRGRPGAHARLNTTPSPPIMTTITMSTPWIIWP